MFKKILIAKRGEKAMGLSAKLNCAGARRAQGQIRRGDNV